MKISEISVDQVLFLILMAVVPTVLTVILSFIFIFLPGAKNDIIQSLIVLPLSFIFFPLIILRKQNKVNLEELGICKPRKIDMIICCACILVFYSYLFLNYGIATIIPLSIQTMIVAISEEFWARGVLFYILRKIFHSWPVIVLISSIIFVFITHMNRELIENVLYRLPGGFIMGLIYQKTGKLHYSIFFHFFYNVLGSL